MQAWPLFRKYLLTVIFMTVVIGGSWTVLRMKRQAETYKRHQLYHTLAARTLADHIAGCRTRAEAEERNARAIRAAKSVTPEEESQARDLLANAQWWRENAEATQKQLDYQMTLVQKYEQLAKAPWKPLTPDPPAPERWNGKVADPSDSLAFPADDLEDQEVESWRRMVLEHARAKAERENADARLNAAAAP